MLNKDKTQARQGETGHHVRYILGISFFGALIILFVLAGYFA